MNSKNIFIPLLLFTSFLCVFAPGSYDEIDPYFASDPSKGLVDLEGVIEHDNARSEKLSVLRGFSPNKEKKRVQKKSCNTFSGFFNILKFFDMLFFSRIFKLTFLLQFLKIQYRFKKY
ncbi:hypothetical protein ACQ4LE_001604 [Meloidogyne hapla]